MLQSLTPEQHLKILQSPEAKVMCIYHAGCMDGTIAAWLIQKKLGDKHIDFHALGYHSTIPDVTGMHVVIVDFSFEPGILIEASKVAESILMLDHHTRAMKKWSEGTHGDLLEYVDVEQDENIFLYKPVSDHLYYWQYCSGNMRVIFDMNLSGAGMAYYSFGGAILGEEKTTLIVKYAQDYDLWLFHHPESLFFITAAAAEGIATDRRFDILDDIASPVTGRLDYLIKKGKEVVEQNDQLINTIIKTNTKMIECYGHRVPICNIPAIFRSRAGDILNKDHPFSITYDDILSEGIRKFSLRSSASGVNVDTIANMYGGGGHEHSAAFFKPLGDKLTSIFHFFP